MTFPPSAKPRRSNHFYSTYSITTFAVHERAPNDTACALCSHALIHGFCGPVGGVFGTKRGPQIPPGGPYYDCLIARVGLEACVDTSPFIHDASHSPGVCHDPSAVYGSITTYPLSRQDEPGLIFFTKSIPAVYSSLTLSYMKCGEPRTRHSHKVRRTAGTTFS